jgi:hypothetical protein
MKMPKIAADDLLLFGSIALAAIGAALVTLETTDRPLVALGVLFVVFGVPTALITLAAAGEDQ